MWHYISLVLLAAPGFVVAADWPHWRGPSRSGITDEESGWTGGPWLPEKPTWTADVGEGASSPLVVGDRVYTLGWESGKDVLRCLSAKNGTAVWSVNDKCPKYGRFHMGDEGLYSGPSSTPEYDLATNRIYTVSTDGDLNCWDAKAEGKKVWGRNLYDDYKAVRRPHLGRPERRRRHRRRTGRRRVDRHRRDGRRQAGRRQAGTRSNAMVSRDSSPLYGSVPCHI